jgi:hypothetical protein
MLNIEVCRRCLAANYFSGFSNVKDGIIWCYVKLNKETIKNGETCAIDIKTGEPPEYCPYITEQVVSQ